MKVTVVLAILITAVIQLEARHPYFMAGYDYTYDFYEHTLGNLPENGNRHAGTAFKGQFTVFAPNSKTSVIIKLKDVQTGFFNGDLRTPDEELIEWSFHPITGPLANSLQMPIEVTFGYGIVSLIVSKDDTYQSINLKKAIIAQLLVTTNHIQPRTDTSEFGYSIRQRGNRIATLQPSYPELYKVYEDGIKGITEVRYVIEQLPSPENPHPDVKNITKDRTYRILDENMPVWNRTTHAFIFCADCDSDNSKDHVITTVVQTKMNIDESKSPMAMEEIQTFGITKYAPLGDGGDYIVMNDTQIFRLKEVTPTSIAPVVLKPEPVNSLKYVFPTAAMAKDQHPLKYPLVPYFTFEKGDALEKAKEVCSEMMMQIISEASSRGYRQDTSKKFQTCVKFIRTLTYEELKVLLNDLCYQQPGNQFPIEDCEQMLVDSMTASRSPPAYVTLLALIARNKIRTSGLAIRAIQSFLPFELSEELINEVFNAAVTPSVTSRPPLLKAFILSVANLVNKACNGPDDDIPRFPSRPYTKEHCPDEMEKMWIMKLGQGLRNASTAEFRLLYLTALAVTRSPLAIPFIAPYAIGRKTANEMVQTAALHSLKVIGKFSPDEVKQIAEQVYYNTDNSLVVRIVSLKILLANSDFSDVQHIVASIKTEPDDEVKGYATRAIRAFANATHYCTKELSNSCQQLLEGVDEEDENGALVGSNLWEFSTMLEDIDFSTQTIISSTTFNRSVWPTIFTYSANNSVGGLSYTVGKLFLHATGYQRVLNSLIGPRADFFDYNTLDDLFKPDSEFEDANRTPINKKLNLDTREDKPFYVHGIWKHLDTSTTIIYHDRHTLRKQILPGTILGFTLDNLKNGVRLHHHRLSIPYEVKSQIPSMLGIPHLVEAITSSITSVNASLKINADFKNTKAEASILPGYIEWQYKGKISYTSNTNVTLSSYNPFEYVKSKIGVSTQLYVAPRVAATGLIHFFSGESSLTISPFSTQGANPKLFQYKVQPYSNQYSVIDIDHGSNYKPIKSTPKPNAIGVIDLSKTPLNLPLVLRRISELDDNDYAAFKSYFEQYGDIFSYFAAWWAYPKFAARKYQLYLKPMSGAPPQVTFSSKVIYTPTEIERVIMGAKTTSLGFWTHLGGFGRLPAKCTASGGKTSEGFAYYSSDSKPVSPDGPYDYYGHQYPANNFTTGYPITHKGFKYQSHSQGPPLIVRPYPRGNEESILKVSWKVSSITAEKSSEIRSDLKWTRDHAIPKDIIEKKIVLQDTSSTKSTYCIKADILYPVIPCDYYRGLFDHPADPVHGTLTMKWGESSCENSQGEVSVKAKFLKSKEQQQIENQKKEWYYQKCTRDMTENIRFSYACRTALEKRTSLNRMELDIKFSNLPRMILNLTHRIDARLKTTLYRQMTNNPVGVNNGLGQLRIESELSEEVGGVARIRLYKPTENTFFYKIYLDDYIPYVYPVSTYYKVSKRFVDDITDETVAATCIASSGGYFNTFSNTTYRYPLKNCYHVLVKDCSPDDLFAVTVANKETSSGVTKALRIYVLEHEFTITASSPFNPTFRVYQGEDEVEVFEDKVVIGKSITPPTLNLISIILTGKVLHVNLPSFGVYIRHTGTDIITMVTTFWSGRVCGLCDQYDGKTDEDGQIGPDQCEYPDSTSFALSYALKSNECAVPEPPNPNKICDRINSGGPHPTSPPIIPTITIW